MKWLYDERVIRTLFVALIVATPLVAACGYFIHSRLAGGCPRRARVIWAVVALFGPANFGLWHLFNALENLWGLDRVKPLVINFCIFVSLGVVIGLLLRFLLRPDQMEAQSPGASRRSGESKDY